LEQDSQIVVLSGRSLQTLYSILPYGFGYILLLLATYSLKERLDLTVPTPSFLIWALLCGLSFGLQYLVWIPTDGGTEQLAIFLDDGIFRSVFPTFCITAVYIAIKGWMHRST
jgi:hypothetical protein